MKIVTGQNILIDVEPLDCQFVMPSNDDGTCCGERSVAIVFWDNYKCNVQLCYPHIGRFISINPRESDDMHHINMLPLVDVHIDSVFREEQN